MKMRMKKMWNFLKRSKETKSNFQEKRPKKLNLEGFFNLNNKLKKTVQTAVKQKKIYIKNFKHFFVNKVF